MPATKDVESICVLSSDEEENEDEVRQGSKRKSKNSIDETENTSKKLKTDASVICLDSDDDSEVILIKDEENSERKTTEIEPPNEDLQKTSISSKEESETQEVIPEQNEATFMDGTNIKIDSVSGTETSKSLNDLKGIENLPDEAVKFLETCRRQLENTSAAKIIEKKFPQLVKIFHSMANELSNSNYLKKYLREETEACNSPESGVFKFKEVYEYFKKSCSSEGIELSEEEVGKLKKIRKTMHAIQKRMQELEEQEVDFDADENDSPYIQLDTYARRLTKLHQIYCKLVKTNPNAGRLTHERIDFMSSDYSDINIAISKKYKNNKKFPSYDEIHTLIKEVVENKKLSLTESQIKYESDRCFQKLGELMQQRRKKELYEIHRGYINYDSDPSAKDSELEAKLRENAKEAKIKIEAVFEEYVKKQESKKDEEISCEESEEDSNSESDEGCSEVDEDEGDLS